MPNWARASNTRKHASRNDKFCRDCADDEPIQVRILEYLPPPVHVHAFLLHADVGVVDPPRGRGPLRHARVRPDLKTVFDIVQRTGAAREGKDEHRHDWGVESKPSRSSHHSLPGRAKWVESPWPSKTGGLVSGSPRVPLPAAQSSCHEWQARHSRYVCLFGNNRQLR